MAVEAGRQVAVWVPEAQEAGRQVAVRVPEAPVAVEAGLQAGVRVPEALEKAEREGFTGTDCAGLVERLGVRVRTCPGRAENFKITHAADLARAEAVLAARGTSR